MWFATLFHFSSLSASVLLEIATQYIWLIIDYLRHIGKNILSEKMLLVISRELFQLFPRHHCHDHSYLALRSRIFQGIFFASILSSNIIEIIKKYTEQYLRQSRVSIHEISSSLQVLVTFSSRLHEQEEQQLQ